MVAFGIFGIDQLKVFDHFIIHLYVLYGKAVRGLHSLIARFRLICYGAKVGKHLSVRGWINLHISPSASVVIGNNVLIKSGFPDNPVGGSLRTGIWAERGARLTIGNDTGLANVTIVCSKSISVGENTFIGGGTVIYDTDFHSLDPAVRVRGNDDHVRASPINIGNECWIGGHCIILKGVTVGNQAIVGAGSVVTKDIPPGQIWAGNPAKFIKELKGESE